MTVYIENHGYISCTPYLNDYATSVIIPRVIRINNCEFPVDFSSISKSKSIAFIKSCSEMLERELMGFNSFSNRSSKFYNFMCNSYELLENINKGYGNTPNFGYCDSTGTATGFKSYDLITKALGELIEKNEVMLFWYKGLGAVFNDECIRKKFSLVDFKHNIYVFTINKLSSMITCVTFIFNENNKLMSTGVSCCLSEEEALEKSIEESLLLLNIYGDSVYSPLHYLSEKEHEEIYLYIEKQSKNMKNKNNIENSINKNIIFSSCIKKIYITLLESRNYHGQVTIKMFSPELLSCLPRKDYINNNNSKGIIREFDILSSLDDVPECIIL